MNVSGKKKSFKSTCGVKGGNNLGTILFIFMIQAVSTTLDKKWDFETPDFNWPSMKADGRYKWWNSQALAKVPVPKELTSPLMLYSYS
jgi:hypothetical protein